MLDKNGSLYAEMFAIEVIRHRQSRDNAVGLILTVQIHGDRVHGRIF